jgi:F-type H+-transporting ATPase subunit b
MLRFDLNVLWTVIDLLILYFLLKKFLFGRVHKILDQRAKDIEKSYTDAENTQKDADALKTKYEETIKSIDDEKKKAADEARAKANMEYDRIVDSAKADADKIINDARAKAAAETTDQKHKAEEDIVEMVKDAAARIAEAEDDDKMYDAFLKKVSANKDKKD